MSYKKIIALVVLVLLGLGAYYTAAHKPNPSNPPPESQTQTTGSVNPGSCVSQNGLPDKTCTPGVTNPNVTQDNIQQTICVSGYTKTIRPPVSYTDNLKKKQMSQYKFTDSPSNYEEDHLIALEIGGHPTDEKNLWPEPRIGQYSASNKDGFENYLHRQVCSGAMSLQEAQNEMSTNWVQYWVQAGSPR
jgi:hypothetical protein